MHIEETIDKEALPVNSIAMASRLIELMQESETNCLESIKDSWKIKAILWLLNSQVFGQLAVVDMHDLWHEINEERTEHL